MRFTIANGPDRLDLAAALFDKAAGRIFFHAEEFHKPIEACLSGISKVPGQESSFLLIGRMTVGNELRQFQFIYDAVNRRGILDV